MLRKSRPALAFVLAICSLAGAVHAEDDPVEAATRRLAGQRTRDWLAGDVKTFMGSGQECTGGGVYHFSRDHTLRMESCVDGRRSETRTTWSLAQEGPLDMVLMTGERIYRLLFRTEKNREYMTLREASTSKVQPTRDHDFVLSED